MPTEVLNDPGEEVKGVDWGAVETILKQQTLIRSSYSFLKIRIKNVAAART